MNELSLFTGAGGGLLGSKILGWRTIGMVENDPYCQKILKQRIADGILDPAPIYGDIRKFISKGYAECYKGVAEIITGGFPCQDISSAGSGAGLEGERSGLWKEMSEIIGIVRPKFILVENSPMLAIRGGVRVIGDLTSMGYDCKWGVVGASHTGGYIKRERMWIFASTIKKSRGEFSWGSHPQWGDMGDNIQIRPLLNRYMEELERQRAKWETQGKGDLPPYLCRVGNEMANELEQLKAIGNGQVPLCMAYAYAKLSEGID